MVISLICFIFGFCWHSYILYDITAKFRDLNVICYDIVSHGSGKFSIFFFPLELFCRKENVITALLI